MVEHDPQLRESDFVMDSGEDDPMLGRRYGDRLPIEFEKTPCDTYRPTQAVGTDNAEVLADWLGMSEAEVREGEERGYLT